MQTERLFNFNDFIQLNTCKRATDPFKCYTQGQTILFLCVSLKIPSKYRLGYDKYDPNIYSFKKSKGFMSNPRLVSHVKTG